MAKSPIDRVVKRIQSRVKAVTKADTSIPMWRCRQAYDSIVANPDFPTEEEINSIVQALSSQCDSETTAGEIQTVTVEPDTTFEPIPTPETLDIPVEDVPCLQPPVEEAGAIANEEDFVIAPQEQEPDGSIVPQQPGQIQPPALGGISEAQVTQAIGEAIAQVGQQGNAEAVQLLTSLADELSADIKDTQEMVTALVTAYLGKRQLLLSSAVGTLNSLRSAQTESFQAGLDQSFFGAKHLTKREFLSKVGAMFN